MKLYGYWRSSSSWRVRIALNLKGLRYDFIPVNLAEGEQHANAYRAINPAGMVPMLEVEESGTTVRLAQSIAILEYLEERHPSPALLPQHPYLRARTRMLAEHMNSSIQPLHNLKVLQYVEQVLHGERKAFAAHWIDEGLRSLQQLADETAGTWLVGEHPTFADACLIPQLYAARRFGVDLSPYGLLLRVEATANEHPAFVAAHADKQPDAKR
ncbi:MAG: maleylacetoacetate isomerase [Myxococcaceae bacterium]